MAVLNITTRNSVHYSCARFWYPGYWMCIEYKDCVYNCWEINVWSLLLALKCCKMLLEDGEARRWRNATSCLQVPDTTDRHITRDDRARLVSSNRERFAHYKHISFFFNKYSLSLCVHTRGLLGCLLERPKPCGGKDLVLIGFCKLATL